VRGAGYLEVAEAKLIDSEQFVEGTLTQFSGFPFGRDHPFTYLEGKRVLGLAMNELSGRRDLKAQLGMNPKASGRGAITGSGGDAVWDFLSLTRGAKAEDFTNRLQTTQHRMRGIVLDVENQLTVHQLHPTLVTH
jgi:hypothetical protein